MLTAEGCRNRRARLWDALPEKPDAVVLSLPRHLVYFANYYLSPFVFSSQNATAILILTPDGGSTLVVDSLTRGFADAAHVDRVVAAPWYDGQHSAGSREGTVQNAANVELKRMDVRRVAFDRGVPFRMLRDGGFEGAKASCGLFADLQRAKDPDEVAVMRRSATAGEAGFQAAIDQVRPGMTELQAYQVIANAAMEAIGQQAVVYGDFASGPRAQHGGGPPTGRVIEKNDLFILDFSVVVHGYRADFANTFIVDGGTADPRLKDLEALCLGAMEAAERLLRAGAVCREVDRAARAALVTRDRSYEMRHHVGHGLGLGHPDPPYIVPESDETLREGDIVTIEPGQYHEGLGGMRFERNYLITADGYELLTHHFLGLEPRA